METFTLHQISDVNERRISNEENEEDHEETEVAAALMSGA